MKHHTVPSSYLAAWASGRRQTLCAFRIEDGIWLPNQKPRNVAFAHDFYTVEADDRNVVEREIGRIESEALPVIRDIEAKRFPISARGIASLITFVALMHVRTMHVRRGAQQRADLTFRQYARDRYPNAEALAETRRHAAAAGTPLPDLRFEDLREMLESSEVTFGLDQTFVLGSMIAAWREVSVSFGSRAWSIWRRTPRAPLFVTSDHPVGLIHDTNENTRTMTPFKADPRLDSIVVAMPLSPNTLLVGDFLGARFVEATPREVAMFNSAVCIPGREWVYTATRNIQWMHPETRETVGAAALPSVAAQIREGLSKIYEEDATMLAQKLGSDGDAG